MKNGKTSVLEHTVLGLAWLRGPCTIYSIMKQLSLSSSSFHKSRAGTAYSIGHRLLASGHLEYVEGEGEKEDRNVRISEKGLEALRQWLRPPVPYEDISHSADLLRLRFFFLGSISLEERLAFIDNAIEGLEQFLRRCESLLGGNEELGDYFGVLATMSSILETQARIKWLRIVRKWVAEPMPEGVSWAEWALSTCKAAEDGIS